MMSFPNSTCDVTFEPNPKPLARKETSIKCQLLHLIFFTIFLYEEVQLKKSFLGTKQVTQHYYQQILKSSTLDPLAYNNIKIVFLHYLHF